MGSDVVVMSYKYMDMIIISRYKRSSVGLTNYSLEQAGQSVSVTVYHTSALFTYTHVTHAHACTHTHTHTHTQG